MRRTRLLLGAVLLLVGGRPVASSTPSRELVARHEMSSSSHVVCPQAAANHWPDNFYCPAGSTCLSNAGNTTLICCPSDNGCARISRTPCDINSYNADMQPEAMAKTTALNGILPRCGDACCPFGYHCSGDNTACLRDEDQNPAPIQTTPTKSSTTASSSSTTSTVASSSTTPSHTPTSTVPPSTTTAPGQNNGASSGADTSPTSSPETGSTGTPMAVIAGVSIGAVLLAAAIAFIAFIFFKRRRRHRQEEAEEAEKALKPGGGRSTSSFGNIISNPIVAANTTMRSDFVLRKSPGGDRRTSFNSVSTLVNDGTNMPATPSPTRARMREGVGTTTRIPPIRNMRQAEARQARQSSIAYGVGAPETSPYGSSSSNGNYHQSQRSADDSGPYPVTPRQQQGGVTQEREPSSFSINVFADPKIATPQRNEGRHGASPPATPDMRRHSRMTTFSDMLRSADLGEVARGEPYVPGSQNGTPSPRRR